MTTEYIAKEDRISVTAHVSGGDNIVRLWLTRRITDRLVAALVKAIQPKHQDPVYAEMIGEIAQQRAELRHEPQEPVQAARPDAEWLVRKIDLKLAENGAAMVFVGPTEEQARLTMNVELLRQWLGILRKVYMAGEWPIAQWPDSLQDMPSTRTQSTVLH